MQRPLEQLQVNCKLGSPTNSAASRICTVPALMLGQADQCRQIQQEGGPRGPVFQMVSWSSVNLSMLSGPHTTTAFVSPTVMDKRQQRLREKPERYPGLHCIDMCTLTATLVHHRLPFIHTVNSNYLINQAGWTNSSVSCLVLSRHSQLLYPGRLSGPMILHRWQYCGSRALVPAPVLRRRIPAACWSCHVTHSSCILSVCLGPSFCKVGSTAAAGLWCCAGGCAAASLLTWLHNKPNISSGCSAAQTSMNQALRSARAKSLSSCLSCLLPGCLHSVLPCAADVLTASPCC